MRREPDVDRSGQVLGVLLAGGANRRYGSHKALATIDGVTILDRGLETLDAVCHDVVIIANEPEPYAHSGREIRPDSRPGTGVLGGILTAVEWARDLRLDGALVLACDMPFVPSALLRELVRLSDRKGVAVPDSGGRRGLEPLCAVYGVDCAASIERVLDAGERAVVSFFPLVPVSRLSRTDVARYGAEEEMFFNVNRPGERELAEEVARSPGIVPRRAE
jgi:molybdopterin-guanine dinucleotide biosynthesis protein A